MAAQAEEAADLTSNRHSSAADLQVVDNTPTTASMNQFVDRHTEHRCRMPVLLLPGGHTPGSDRCSNTETGTLAAAVVDTKPAVHKNAKTVVDRNYDEPVDRLETLRRLVETGKTSEPEEVADDWHSCTCSSSVCSAEEGTKAVWEGQASGVA